MKAGSVLILGAASDIGREVARAYAKAGHPLILAARRSERLAPDAADLRIRWGVSIRTVDFDVLELASHRGLLDELGETPEIVVLLIGILCDQQLAAVDLREAELALLTNFVAPALLLGEIANRMERLGRGTIIGVSSVAGDRGRAANYVYGSAKAGLNAFLSGLRNRLSAKGVRVITVKPGFVDTRMTENMTLPPLLTAQPVEVAAAIVAAQLKGRDIVYVRRVWRPIMFMIRALPERVFKRLSL